MENKGLSLFTLILMAALVVIAIILIVIFGGSYTGNIINPYGNQSNKSAQNVQNQTPGQSYSVSINNFAFSPADLTIKKGDSVIWTNNQAGTPHTVTSDSGNELESAEIQTGQTYSHTFNTPGTYPYHCSIHPTMHGTITVQ